MYMLFMYFINNLLGSVFRFSKVGDQAYLIGRHEVDLVREKCSCDDEHCAFVNQATIYHLLSILQSLTIAERQLMHWLGTGEFNITV